MNTKKIAILNHSLAQKISNIFKINNSIFKIFKVTIDGALSGHMESILIK